MWNRIECVALKTTSLTMFRLENCRAESRIVPSQTDTLSSCAEEDRRCAKGVMGEGEGGEEDGIAGWRDTVIERVIWRGVAV